MSNDDNEYRPPTGDFPFPLTKGARESRYLTWLRNHSNYMATRGFLDYLRLVAVLVRGMLINFLTMLPIFLLLGVGIGWWYRPILEDRKLGAWQPGIITNLVEDTLFYRIGQGPQVIEHGDGALIKAVEAVPAGEFDQATLTVSITEGGVPAQDRLSIGNQEELTDHLSLRHATNLFMTVDGVEKEIGSFEGGTNGTPLKISYNISNAPPLAAADALAELVRNITYEIDEGASGPTNRLLTVQFKLTGDSGEVAGISGIQYDAKIEVSDQPDMSSVSNMSNEFKLLATKWGGKWVEDMREKPFHLTETLLVIAVIWILLYPLVTRFAKIVRYKHGLETGSDSSVKLRDLLERTFGGALLVLLAGGFLDSLPFLVEFLNQSKHLEQFEWRQCLALASGILIVLLGVNKLLSRLDGAKKMLAMLLVAFLGLFVPLLAILHVTEFLIYKNLDLMSLELELGVLALLGLLAPFVFGIMIGIAMLFGLFKKAFKPGDCWKLLLLIGVSFLVGLAMAFALFALDEQKDGFAQKCAYVLAWALEIWVFCRLLVDINLTSIHGLYRDRLASAYLVGVDTGGEVDIEEDIDLMDICNYETRSTAPYHLINVALNLQGSKDIAIRDRQSDFFIFSKKFIGGNRTGYCRSEEMERVYPQMDLATAMAISAAAASPNMGRGTSPATVALMTLLNVRLGYWVPNPGLLHGVLELQDALDHGSSKSLSSILKKYVSLRSFSSKIKKVRNDSKAAKKIPGLTFQKVFEEELVEIEKRWNNVYANPSEPKRRQLHQLNGKPVMTPTTRHGLVGIGFSGGGIRSATINLGIAQALHKHGIFRHLDYMSTVSGGGYLGSSISALMRYRTKPVAEFGGHVRVTPPPKEDGKTETETIVTVTRHGRTPGLSERVGACVRRIWNREADEPGPCESGEYRFSAGACLNLAAVKGGQVKKGQPLLRRSGSGIQCKSHFLQMFRWRVRPGALMREMLSRLDEKHPWVNVSDGGHIENLAGIELLRRRCKFIIIGDGEGDPELAFNGLATLIRYARIDLGIHIEINPDKIRLDRSRNAIDEGRNNFSKEHWAFGTITYPEDKANGSKQETGYLLYLKSSCTGDEDEVIKEYRHQNPDFPHQSTADQSFDEDQFECYRALGQHICEKALAEMSLLESSQGERKPFEALWQILEKQAKERSEPGAQMASTSLDTDGGRDTEPGWATDKGNGGGR